MDNVNSCMRDTDKFQENWATTKFNDFTVLKVLNGLIIKKYRPVYIQFWCQQEIPTAKINFCTGDKIKYNDGDIGCPIYNKPNTNNC